MAPNGDVYAGEGRTYKIEITQAALDGLVSIIEETGRRCTVEEYAPGYITIGIDGPPKNDLTAFIEKDASHRQQGLLSRIFRGRR